MSDLVPAAGPARTRWSIVDALRRYGTDSGRLGQAFAAQHDLRSADVRALVAIMSAEGGGHPLTAGQLRDHLGLSAGGTSLVLDRLERAGHIQRVRDHPADHRVVHLRYTELGMATGLAFFGPLGERTHAILDEFSDEQLDVIARFVTAMAASLHDHVDGLEGTDDSAPETPPGRLRARPAFRTGRAGRMPEPGRRMPYGEKHERAASRQS